MKITFLGTRGYVETSSRTHKKRSSILVTHKGEKLLVDFGDLYSPDELPECDYIVITHAHPDHLFGLKKVESCKVPVYCSSLTLKSEYYKEDDYKHLDIREFKPNSSFKLGKFRITSVPVLHSTKAPNVALFIEAGEYKVCYASDVASMRKADREEYLKGSLVYIGDMSSYKEGGLIRRSKDGTIIGHCDIRTQLAWCRDAGVKYVIFTHLGTDCIEKGDKELKAYIKPLEDKYKVKVFIARDGDEFSLEELERMSVKPEDVEPITPKQLPSSPAAGLYLVPPHAELIWKGKKTLIVKQRKFEKYIGEPLYLIDSKLCYGVIMLEEPKKITKAEFDKLKDEHRITEKEYEQWGWRAPLYAYTFKIIQKYPAPKPIRVPRGVQVFVKAENIKFISAKQMSDEELEYYHAFYHLCSELFSPCCTAHYEIATEMLSRGMYHYYRAPCDRIIELDELIKESSEKWVNEYLKNIKNYTKAQVGDDFRIVLGWYSSLRRGKKLFKKTKEGKVPITIDDCKKLILGITKELIKRGATFNKPETYKKYARELFEWVIKEIGEENIPFKEELKFELPPGMKIEDIDPEFVIGLTDKELLELWDYLVKEAKKITSDPSKLPENIHNAGVFVGIEMFKRGLWDTYKGDNVLEKAIELEVEEYPSPKGVFMSEEIPEPEGEYITLEDVKRALPPHIIVKGEPFAAYLAGRIVNEGKVPKDHDIDLVLKQLPDPRLVKAIKSIKPEWLAKRLHPVFDPYGPVIGYSVNMYRYGLFKLPAQEMERGYGPYRAQLAKVKIGKPMVGLKPKSGFGKHEFWDPKEMYMEWAKNYIDEGIFVQEKVDGRRMQCVPPDTVVHGACKFIQDIKAGDQVLGYSRKNNVKETFKRYYKGEVIKVKVRGLEVLLTPEHPVLAVKARRCKYPSKRSSKFCRPDCTNQCLRKPSFEARWVPAYMLKDKDWVLIPKVKCSEEDYTLTLELPKVNKWTIKEINRVVELNDDLLKLLAWYIAEGDANPVTGSLGFSFSLSEREYVEEVKKLYYKAFKRSLTVNIKEHGIHLFGRSKDIAGFFTSLCGRGALNKHLPPFWDKLSARQLKVLTNTLMKGDGSLKWQTYRTHSKLLAHQLFEAFIKLGKLPSVSKSRGGTRRFGRENRQINVSTGWIITLSRDHRRGGNNCYEDDQFYYVRARVSKERYDGYVYNLETTEHVYALPFIVHNCHVDKSKGIVKIFTEDRQRDRAKQFPNIVKEILDKLNCESCILDGEMVAFKIPSNVEVKSAKIKRSSYDLMEREDTAVITVGKVPKELEDKIVYVFYDVMYYNGKPVVDLPYSERFKLLQKIVPKNARYLDIVRSVYVDTPGDFFKAVEKMRRANGSEGVVCKTANMKWQVKYKGENRSADMCKLKNLKEIDVMVWDVIEKKSKETGKPLGNYMYVSVYLIPEDRVKEFQPSNVVEYKGKHYAIIGRSYATNVKCKRGDIITVMPIRIRKYVDKQGRIKYTWMFPFFKEKRTDKKEPDTLTTVERIAKLGTRPAKLSGEIVIDLELCPYSQDESICPLKKIFGRPRYHELAVIKVQQLKYPVACPLANIFRCVYLKGYYYGYKTYVRDKVFYKEVEGESNEN